MRRSRGKHAPATADYIIPRHHHTLSKTDLSPNALKVLNRLISAGFQAYLVGGSVRDLLLGKVPKDFDIATNATPSQVKSLFRNGKIIGRRFKLVHVVFHREIIEVATFRGSEVSSNQLTQPTQLANEQGMLLRDNVYGTLDEDAWRRDFTINSLYYNLDDASIIDLTGGVSDVVNKTVRIIGDPVVRYQEDPVRMLRAIRFSAKLHFNLAEETAKPLTELSPLIRQVSSSRLFDETIKLYQCGEAQRVQQLLFEHGLFAQLFPQTLSMFDSKYPTQAFLGIALESTDTRIRDNKPVNPAFLFAIFLWFPLLNTMNTLKETENLPSLVALEKAMNDVVVMQNQIICIPKRFSQIMREIWLLQFRFAKRWGERAQHLLQHPRFRAAYDFFALRALAGNESMELAQWWMKFQEADGSQQTAMIHALKPSQKSRKKRKKKPAES